MVNDCPKGFSVCFHYNQTGHRKAEFPQLIQGSAQAPAPAALHVTDGQSGKVKVPRARGRDFPLTAEDVRAAHDIVVGIYLIISVVIMNHLCLCFVSC